MSIRLKWMESPLTGDFTLEEMTGGKTVPENQLFLMGIIVKIV